MFLWHWVQAASGTWANSVVWQTEQLSSAAARCARGQWTAGPESIREQEAAHVVGGPGRHDGCGRCRLDGLAQQQRQDQAQHQHRRDQHPGGEALGQARLRQFKW